MTLTFPHQRVPIVVLGVLLGVLGVCVWQASPTPTEPPIPKQAVVAEATSKVVIPANPELSRYVMDQWLKQVRAGEMFTVVRYHCKDVSYPDRQHRINNNPAFGEVQFFPGEKIRLQGVIEDVNLLRVGFEFGEIEISYRRKREPLFGSGYPVIDPLELVKKVTAGQSFLFLAHSQGGSRLFENAYFKLCLEPEEVPCVTEWFEQAKRYDKVGQPTAEKWLRSSNPWLVWLGISRLDDLKCLNPDHLAGVIERRPAAETERYIVDMVHSGRGPAPERARFQKALERVFQLPGKQIPAMWSVADFLYINSHYKEEPYGPFQVPVMVPWLKKYREQLVAGAADKEIIRAVDALTTVLQRPVRLKGPSTPPSDRPVRYVHNQ